MKMMNVLGLSLIITSLAVAGVFSPSPNSNSNTIVKEGHRVVVVEYDQDGNHNTKISISPPDEQQQQQQPNKELICDSYGRCKHKIADAMGRAKDKISETAHDAIDMIHSKKETVADAVGKARETVYNTAHDVQQQTQESVDKAKEKGQTFTEHVVRNVSEAKDAMRRGATNIVGSMETVMGVANLLGFATAYGMNVWVTFISSHVLSRAMPRQPFGVVQSKIYPVYFRAMAYSIGIALLGHVLSHTNSLFLTISMPQIFQAYNLLASLLTLFINSLYLEPRATKLMLERMKIEKEEGRGREDMMSGERSGSRTQGQGHHHHNTTADPKEPTTTTTTTNTPQGAEHDAARSRIMKLNEKLKKMNSYSSILNILNLMSLTWHLVYLAQRIHLTC